MAASIAEEMLASINAVPYKQIIPAIHSASGISEVMFPHTVLAKQYLLNVSRWVEGSYMNPNTMFEYFGLYSNEDSKQVRKNMQKYMGVHTKKGWENSAILKNSWIALAIQGTNAENWVKNMKKLDTPGDEIALYTLCKMYHCHCYVYTKMKSWCTIEVPHDAVINEEELIDKYEIKLLFVEPGVYGELKTRPYAPPPGTSYLHDAKADIPQIQNKEGKNDNSAPSALDLHSTDTNPDVAIGDNITDPAAADMNQNSVNPPHPP